VCPDDQMVIGYQGTHDGPTSSLALVDSLQVLCGRATITGTGRGYAIATGAPTSLPSYGGVGGSAFRDMCPMGQVARGADIAADSRVVASDLQCALPAVLPCVRDLSNIGTGDFHISFSVMTTQAGLTALINQRATCGCSKAEN